MESKQKKVLVAEDNSAFSNIIRFNLQRAGYAVTVAVNGRVAAEATDKEIFDLIVTDYQMPEMSGEEFLRHVRQNPKYDNVPAVLCSAKGFELDLRRLSDTLKISMVLFKPFSPSVFADSVRTLLQEEPAVAVSAVTE